jgi:hypothetical protein
MACSDATPLIFVQLLDLPFELARLATRRKGSECKTLGSLVAPPPLHEVDAAGDLARRHCPDIGRWIVGSNEGVDRFR